MQLQDLFGKVIAIWRARPRSILARIGIVACICIGLSAPAHADQVSIDYQNLLGQLVNEQVTSVDMIHIPYSVIFTVRVTPAEIQKWNNYSCHVDITPELNTSLLAAVKDAHAMWIDGAWDLRWMLQFNIKGSTSPTILYLNGRSFVGAGQRGYLNGQPMAITSSLSRWMVRISNETCPDLVI